MRCIKWILLILLCLVKFTFNNEVDLKLIGIGFILNNGAEKQADIDEYKYFRNPSLNRDISQIGKIQQKYLGFFLKKNYAHFLNLQPQEIIIYSNQKLKCIMSGIVILNTLFENYSYYFQENKPYLPESYKNQDIMLKNIKELKINYELRRINSFYRICKDKMNTVYRKSLNEVEKEIIHKTSNEYIKVIKNSNYDMNTTLEIYDLIILNRIFKEIKIEPVTEDLFKRLVILESYLKGYSNQNSKFNIIKNVDKMIASEFIFKLIKFVNNLKMCNEKSNSNFNLCEKTIFNFYERQDFIDFISILIDKTILLQKLKESNLKNEFLDEELFDVLYPQYSSYIAIEIYNYKENKENSNERLILKIIFNNSNIVDLLGNFLSFPSIKINSDSYFDFKYFSDTILERMNENKYKDVLKIREECVLLDKLN